MKSTVTLPKDTPAETWFTLDHSYEPEAHVLDAAATIIGWYQTASWYLLAFDKVWTRLLGPLLGSLLRPSLPTCIEQWLWARRGLGKCSVDVQ